jgi:hypothetical protein
VFSPDTSTYHCCRDGCCCCLLGGLDLVKGKVVGVDPGIVLGLKPYNDRVQDAALQGFIKEASEQNRITSGQNACSLDSSWETEAQQQQQQQLGAARV